MRHRPTRSINIHEAKTHLSRLVEDAANGQEIIIAKAGKPVARLTAPGRARKRRTLGWLSGKIAVPADFDDPLPESVLATFEGGVAKRSGGKGPRRAPAR